MTNLQQFFIVPFSRNIDYAACIHRKDLTVLFIPSSKIPTREEDCAQLFLKWDNLIKDRQNGQIKAKNKKTFTIYLVLSEQCNLKCIYCDILGKIDQRKNRSHMTWDIVKASMDIMHSRLIADTEVYAQIVFFGGEPLLNWPILVQTCEYLATQGMNNRIEKMLITNGTLINQEISLFLQKHKVYVVVSLDGRKSVNDSVRYKFNGKGSFDSATQGIKYLIDAIPNKFGISCTLGSHNVLSLSEEIIFLHEQFHPRSIGINIYHYQQDGKSPIQINDEILCQALLNVFKTTREKGIAIYQFLSVLKAFTNRQRNSDYCAACADKLLFTPQGRVGRCDALMFDERFSVSLQDFVSHSMPNNLDWSKFTPEHEQYCLNCAARWICPGGCVYDQLVRTGSLCGVETRRCNFYIRLLNEMLELVLEATLTTEQVTDILIPSQNHFNNVIGNIPLDFLTYIT